MFTRSLAFYIFGGMTYERRKPISKRTGWQSYC